MSFDLFTNSFKKQINHYSVIIIALWGILLFFHPVIFSDQTFYFRDIHRFFFPKKFYLSESFHHYAIPFWNSDILCGSPFLSDIQSGVFYPLSILNFLFPFPLSFNAYILIHFLLGFIFFYLFIRIMGRSRMAALMTAFSFCFGGYMISSINTLNNLSTLIWLPAILWALHGAVADGNGSMYFLTIIFIAMSILGGEPQLTLMSLGIMFFYGLFFIPALPLTPAGAAKRAACLFLLFAAAISLTMVQLGPTYLDYTNSVRAGGFSYEQATQHSVGWPMLKHLVWPISFGGDFAVDPDVHRELFPWTVGFPWLLSIYPGYLILPFAAIAVLFGLSAGTYLWLSISIGCLLLSMGSHTPVFEYFYHIFPVFRYPSKFMFPAGFCLLIMAAFGYDIFISFLRTKKTLSIALSFLLFTGLVADLYFAHRYMNPTCSFRFYNDRHPDLAPIFSDSGLFRVFVDTEKFSNQPNRSIRDTHLLWQSVMMPNTGMLHSISHVGGEVGLELNYQYIVKEMLGKSWQDKILFLRLANVKYIISTDPLDQLPDVNNSVEKLTPLLYRLKDQMPRAWMIGQLQPAKGDILNILSSAEIDPKVTALAPEKQIGSYTKPFFKTVDEIKYIQSGHIRLNVTVDKPSVLVLSEAYYSGWRIFVDGKEKEIIRLNLLFQGTPLIEGKHKIEFIFRPYGFRFFAIYSLISAICFIIGWLYYLRLSKHQHNQKRILK